MATALRTFVESKPDGATSREIRAHIRENYDGQWAPKTLDAHLYGCRVNAPAAYTAHPSAQKFLFKSDDGRFHIYSEDVHGPNVWAPDVDAEDDLDGPLERQGFDDLIDATLSFEKDVEAHLIQHLADIEVGLKFVARQCSIDVGRVDILAEDASGRRVVIELKVGEAKDAAVGQIARYLGWYAREDGTPPRGMLIAGDFPEPVRYAAEAIRDLQLVKYRVRFAFDTVGVETAS